MNHSTNIIVLDKIKYSESVVRKSLYWLSEISKWQLSESNESWEVVIYNTDGLEECICDFHRHLNDFLLREKIDINTGDLRKKIISASLKKMCEG